MDVVFNSVAVFIDDSSLQESKLSGSRVLIRALDIRDLQVAGVVDILDGNGEDGLLELVVGTLSRLALDDGKGSEILLNVYLLLGHEY